MEEMMILRMEKETLSDNSVAFNIVFEDEDNNSKVILPCIDSQEEKVHEFKVKLENLITKYCV